MEENTSLFLLPQNIPRQKIKEAKSGDWTRIRRLKRQKQEQFSTCSDDIWTARKASCSSSAWKNSGDSEDSEDSDDSGDIGNIRVDIIIAIVIIVVIVIVDVEVSLWCRVVVQGMGSQLFHLLLQEELGQIHKDLLGIVLLFLLLFALLSNLLLISQRSD